MLKTSIESEGRKGFVIIAQDGEKSLGSIHFCKTKDSVVKLTYLLASSSESHPFGIGSLLLSALICWAKEHQCTQIEATFAPVPESAEKARRLYENFGFTIKKDGHMALRIQISDGRALIKSRFRK